MKTTRLLIIAAAFAGLASLSFAGAGPDYWARMNAAAQSTAKYTPGSKSTDFKAKPAPAPAISCTACGCAKKT